MSNKELPPLPESVFPDPRYGMSNCPGFTADQMHDYARAALAAQPVAQAPDPQASNDLADAAGICAARGHEQLSIRLLAYSEALAAAPSPEASKPVRCPSCNGESAWNHELPCDTCHGSGFSPTPLTEASKPVQAEAPKRRGG